MYHYKLPRMKAQVEVTIKVSHLSLCRTYLRWCNRHNQMLVLLNCGIASVVTNQILQRRKPFLALPGDIVLPIFTSSLIVEYTELLVHEGKDKASRITLTPANQVCTWLCHGLQSYARNVSANTSMIPP